MTAGSNGVVYFAGCLKKYFNVGLRNQSQFSKTLHAVYWIADYIVIGICVFFCLVKNKKFK